MESKIQPHTAYQKQQVCLKVTDNAFNIQFRPLDVWNLTHGFLIAFQDTLIVWAEADNYDLALSFQEKAGCDELWEKICQVIKRQLKILVLYDRICRSVNTVKLLAIYLSEMPKEIGDIECLSDGL